MSGSCEASLADKLEISDSITTGSEIEDLI
jgi:hypothetical protein